MVIKECIAKALTILDEAGIDGALLESRLLLGKVIDKSDVFVIVNPDYDVPDEDCDTFFSYVHRRAKDEPFAYIVGEKEFMSIPFYVTPAVLIPRPDTEHLAELAIDLCKERGYKQVADFCTGSGALAISVAMSCSDACVMGYEISTEALDVAKHNKDIHNVSNVDFAILDVLTGLEGIDTKYDMVISNPPYISGEEMKMLDKTVGEYEPHLALYGGADGLDFYRVISSSAKSFLRSGGVLAFEVGHDQAQAVKDLMNENFCEIQTKKDYAGIERVVWGKLM